MIRVKVCGITNLDDALACVRAGAEMLGFNFYKASPRYIAPEDARRIIAKVPSEIQSVGIFVNEKSPEEVARLADLARVAAIQLHGDETPDYCRALSERFVIRALRVGREFKPEQAAEYDTTAILLDAFSAKARGGTGERIDWSVARETRRLVPKLFLAGGLSPENVAEAVTLVQPFGVDACSALEDAPGRKNEKLVRAFVAAVRRIRVDLDAEVVEVKK